LVFSIQRLLQLFLGLVVEFVVFARGLASLLPELISPPDNIHFLGCGHASSLKRSPAFGVWGPRAETALLASRSEIGLAMAMKAASTRKYKAAMTGQLPKRKIKVQASRAADS
jgi:hypothetical protein